MLTCELYFMALKKAISQFSAGRSPEPHELFLPVILIDSPVPPSFTAAILFSVPTPTQPILPAKRYRALYAQELLKSRPFEVIGNLTQGDLGRDVSRIHAYPNLRVSRSTDLDTLWRSHKVMIAQEICCSPHWLSSDISDACQSSMMGVLQHLPTQNKLYSYQAQKTPWPAVNLRRSIDVAASRKSISSSFLCQGVLYIFYICQKSSNSSILFNI